MVSHYAWIGAYVRSVNVSLLFSVQTSITTDWRLFRRPHTEQHLNRFIRFCRDHARDRQTERDHATCVTMCTAMRWSVCVWWNVRGGGAANAVDKRTTTRAALTHNIVEADDDIFTDESAQQAYNTIIAHTGHADLPMCKQNLLLFVQPKWQLRTYFFNHYTVLF